MGSGQRQVKQNNLERLISTDLNRMQSFGGAHLAQLIRYWVNLRVSLPNVAGGILAAPNDNTPSTPVADIFEGLMVAPQMGKTSVHVIPGVLGTIDPDAVVNPDDCPYKIVYDVGVSADGVLTVEPNAGGSYRIDVIECQRVDVVETMDSRDIYNPVTESFAPALVDKVTANQLTYRVRQGTVGAGFPGLVQGWLPLAVASVPAGAANNDAVCFWDVRPLVADREWTPKVLQNDNPPPARQLDVIGDWELSGAAMRIYGCFHTSAFGRIYGGKIFKGVGIDNEAYVDAYDTDNQEPGFAPSAGDLVYLWLLTPENLPRWVRYSSPAIGARLPWGTRGIPVLSTKGPGYSASEFRPSSAVVVPTVTGLGSTTTAAACAMSFAANASGPAPFNTDGQWVYPIEDSLPPTKTPSTSSLNTDTYTLTNGTHFPNNARALRVRCGFTLTGTPGTVYTLNSRPELVDGAGTDIGVAYGACSGTVTIPAGGSLVVERDFTIPRHAPWAAVGVNGDVRLKVNWNCSGGSKATEYCKVIGWKLG